MNQAVFEFVQSLTGNSVLDQLMLYMAEYLVIFVPLTLAYLWFQGREGKQDSVLTFGSAVTGIIVAYLLGMIYSHQNPSVTYETIVAAKPSENAFPSQHTAVVFATAFGYLARKRKSLGFLMTVAALLTGFARIYIGEHWPIDVLGSVVAASAGTLVAYYGEEYIEILDPVFRFSEKIEERLPIDLDW